MRKLFVLIVLSATLISCEKKIGGWTNWDEMIYSNSIIGSYHESDGIEIIQVDSGIAVRFDVNSYSFYFDVQSTGYEKDIFESLAVAHGDTSYNDSLKVSYIGYLPTKEITGGPWYELYALINEVVHIDVITIEDWDECHPAGSSLNDIITFYGSTLKEYIQSGYPNKGNCSKKDMLTDVVKPLEDMTQADYELTTISYNEFRFTLKFDSLPPDSVRKKVKIVLEMSNETVDFEVKIKGC